MKFSYISITNTGLDTIIFDPKEVLGILEVTIKLSKVYYNKI